MSDDINQEILVELRGVKSIGRRLFWLLLLLVIVSVLAFPISRRSRSAFLSCLVGVSHHVDETAGFSQGSGEAQGLVAQQPNYYYGHAYLGAIHLAKGDVTNAQTHTLRAYELFPNEQSEKDLAAVRKRLPSRSQ